MRTVNQAISKVLVRSNIIFPLETHTLVHQVDIQHLPLSTRVAPCPHTRLGHDSSSDGPLALVRVETSDGEDVPLGERSILG